MRLFAAIALDHATRDRVAAEQRRLVAALGTAAVSSLRLVGPDQLHLTLAFIGEVADSRGVSIASRFAVDIEQRPFALALGGAGVFPARGPSRVLWLGVLEGVEEFTVLQERVVRRLAESGVDVDRRRLSPHLTLGRWRARGRSRPAPDGRGVSFSVLRSSFDVRRTENTERRTENGEPGTENAERSIARIEVNEVTMFQSRLSATGSTYTAVSHARLTCPSSS